MQTLVEIAQESAAFDPRLMRPDEITSSRHKGGTYGYVVYGTAGSDNLSTGSYNDCIIAYGGSDYILSAEGDDLIFPGPGADYVTAGPGKDTISYIDATQGATIDIYLSNNGGAAAGDNLFNDIEHVVATYYSDHITGNYSNNYIYALAGDDVVYGLGGDDFIYPLTGLDRIDGGPGFDVVSYKGVTNGITVDMASHVYDTGEAAGDIYFSIEGFAGTQAMDSIRGDASGNLLIGYSGSDFLNGRAGDDTLVGGFAHDYLTGGSGADRFVYATRLDGGDIITDFSPSEGDKIVMNKNLFAMVFGFKFQSGPGGGPASAKSTMDGNFVPTIRYDTDTGKLFIDVGWSPIELATFVGIPDLKGTDIATY